MTKNEISFKNYSRRQLKDSIENYNKRIRLNSNLEENYYNRAKVKHYLQDYKGAIADFKKSIELDPNNAEAYYNIAISKKYLGDIDGYVKYLEIYEKLEKEKNIFKYQNSTDDK